jgi:hypothetical protein
VKFSKIKYNGEKVRLTWTEKKDGAELEHNLTSVLAPAPDLPNALKGFSEFVEELLEVPHDWMDSLTVTGIRDHNARAAVVLFVNRGHSKRSPMRTVRSSSTTPHLRESIKPGENGPGFFLDGMPKAIARAEEAAAAFVAGKRAQRDLFKTDAPNKRQLDLIDGGKPPKNPRGRGK